MDMGRVVRWSRKLSVNKVAWFLRSWYVFLPACCFLPEMEGFSDRFLAPKWYGVVATIVIIAALESGLYLFRKGHDDWAVSDSGMGSILRGVFRWRLLVKACMFCSSSASSSGVWEQGLRALLTIRPV